MFAVEFCRAVNVSSGYRLNSHVVNTVFLIFDANDDGQLSYAEFIAVMQDRIHRGFKVCLEFCSHSIFSHFSHTKVPMHMVGRRSKRACAMKLRITSMSTCPLQSIRHFFV